MGGFYLEYDPTAFPHHCFGQRVSVGVEVLQHVLERVPLLFTQSVSRLISVVISAISVTISITATFFPIIASSVAVIAIPIALRFGRFSPGNEDGRISLQEFLALVTTIDLMHEYSVP